MTPSDYHNWEIMYGGRTSQSVCDELNSLDCNEDKPYKDACGGTFTPTNIGNAWSKLVYRTESATSTDGFFSAVGLVGSINFPLNYGLTVLFQISTSPAVDWKGCLSTAVTTTIPLELTASGATQTVNSAVSGQAIGLYYYQVVVITNCGLDTEEAFCGNVVQYPINGPTRAPTVSPTKAPTTKPVCSFATRNTTVRLST